MTIERAYTIARSAKRVALAVAYILVAALSYAPAVGWTYVCWSREVPVAYFVFGGVLVYGMTALLTGMHAIFLSELRADIADWWARR